MPLRITDVYSYYTGPMDNWAYIRRELPLKFLSTHRHIGTSLGQMGPLENEKKIIRAYSVENCWLRMCANVAVKIAGAWPAWQTSPLDTARKDICAISVADQDVYPGSTFFPPGSESFPSRINISELWSVCSSWILILIFYLSRIPGSKRHRIPDTQHCIV